MKQSNDSFTLEVSKTDNICQAGETAGSLNRAAGKIPVLSCEGGCLRGDIARLAAHLVAKEEPYRRGCHGELLTAPTSALADWIRNADKVVLIDGCFLRCHGRILENLVERDKLVQFDALSFYKKYTDLFEIDSVPETERKATARLVADLVLSQLRKMGIPPPAGTGCRVEASGAAQQPACKAKPGCGC